VSGDDALPDEMRRILSPHGRGPLELDEGTAERLLSGQLQPSDAPPQYAAVAGALADAAARAHPDELRGEREIRAAFRAAVRPARPSRTRARRRSATRVGVLPAKVALMVAVLVVTLAGAAVASVTLLAPAERPVPATRSPGGQPGAESPESGSEGSAPDATRPPKPAAAAAAGLCRAYFAGAKDQQEKATAFQALSTAAGGSGRVADYCRGVGVTPSTTPHDVGKPARGNGRGEQPPACGRDADGQDNRSGGNGAGRGDPERVVPDHGSRGADPSGSPPGRPDDPCTAGGGPAD
jgi:hypothetical protein